MRNEYGPETACQLLSDARGLPGLVLWELSWGKQVAECWHRLQF